MRKQLWGALIMGGLWATQASAVNTQGQDGVYGYLLFAQEFSDSARQSDDGIGFQTGFGKALDGWANTALEGTFYNVKRDRDIDGRSDYQSALTLDLVRDFGLMGEAAGLRFTPFVLGGLGFARDDVRGERSNRIGANAGGGLLFETGWRGVGVRTEARALIQNNSRAVPGEDLLIDYRVAVGLQAPLAALWSGSAAKASAPARADCELAVVHLLDRRNSCETDSDRDGVPDGVDQCPGTEPGTMVNFNGCPVEAGTDVISGVNFETGSAVLTPDSIAILEGVASSLKAMDDKNATVEIGGYTDTIGSQAYNLLLSRQRAESVRQYLIGAGVPADQLVAQGYGEASPRASNETDDGRAQNRRVEFKIVLR